MPQSRYRIHIAADFLRADQADFHLVVIHVRNVGTVAEVMLNPAFAIFRCGSATVPWAIQILISYSSQISIVGLTCRSSRTRGSAPYQSCFFKSFFNRGRVLLRRRFHARDRVNLCQVRRGTPLSSFSISYCPQITQIFADEIKSKNPALIGEICGLNFLPNNFAPGQPKSPRAQSPRCISIQLMLRRVNPRVQTFRCIFSKSENGFAGR